ncbi:MAG: ABC transporter permease [Chloroflexi bacterium]|nr:ABC transporter permease [Chloroflexota bacterium]
MSKKLYDGLESKEINRIKKKSQVQFVLSHLFKNRLAVAGILFLSIMIISSIAIGFLVDYKVIVKHDLRNKLLGVSARYWFGTDGFGRNLFYRIIYGARISLMIGFVSVAGSTVLGGTIGSIAGYYGGKLDIIIMRFIDIQMAIPSTLFAICIVSVLGTGITNLLLAIMIADIPQFALIFRSSVMSVKNSEFVEAARSNGCSTYRIIFRHILPNCMGPIIVQATLNLGGVILTAASLSFIGLGVMPPTPEWGVILTEGQEYMRDFPTLVIFPGLAIMLTVLACNFIGDGLRDALDPKLK